MAAAGGVLPWAKFEAMLQRLSPATPSSTAFQMYLHAADACEQVEADGGVEPEPLTLDACLAAARACAWSLRSKAALSPPLLALRDAWDATLPTLLTEVQYWEQKEYDGSIVLRQRTELEGVRELFEPYSQMLPMLRLLTLRLQALGAAADAMQAWQQSKISAGAQLLSLRVD